MKSYYLVGYLVPAAIVLVSLAIDQLALSGATYGSAHACWMEPGLLFRLAFLLPLVLVLLINLSMLALVIVKVWSWQTPWYTLFATSSRAFSNRFQVYRIKPRPAMFGQARGWFSLALLLGKCTIPLATTKKS